DPDDDATILYTSGTTGNPKGAVSTHRAVVQALLGFGCRSAIDRLRNRTSEESAAPRADDPLAFILVVPLFHVTGCVPVMLSCLASGLKLVIMYKWDPERALELIERERVTNFGGVPAMVWQVLDSPDFKKRDTSSVQAIGYGGAPAPPELLRRIKEHFPTGSPSNRYGLTETSSVSTMNAGDDYFRKPDSVGPPVPVVGVKVVDENGSDVAPGDVGELWISGPNIVKGYWNKPDATAATFTDGWLHSGD